MKNAAHEFIAHLDLLSQFLVPARRPQDRNLPECSPAELRALSVVGRRGTLPMTELAAILGVPQSTATHTVDKLVAKGLVERKRAESDRRVVEITFSKKGAKINRFVVESRLALGQDLLKGLSASEREALAELLAKLAARVERK